MPLPGPAASCPKNRKPVHLAPTRPTGNSDVPEVGRFTGCQARWPVGSWACRMVHRSLTWALTHRPPIGTPPLLIEVSDKVQVHNDEMLSIGVVEDTPSKVFLLRPFTILKHNSLKDHLFVDHRVLNRFVITRKLQDGYQAASTAHL